MRCIGRPNLPAFLMRSWTREAEMDAGTEANLGPSPTFQNTPLWESSLDALEDCELQAEGFGLRSGVGPEGALDRAKVGVSVVRTSSWMFPNFN